MRVRNLINSKGNQAANQFVIIDDDGFVFQSYNTIIAEVVNGDVTLDRDNWDYSATTLKFLKIFLDTTVSKKAIQARIESGEYKLRNLNE